MLDAALLRAGRFDRQITVGLPDIKVLFTCTYMCGLLVFVFVFVCVGSIYLLNTHNQHTQTGKKRNF